MLHNGPSWPPPSTNSTNLRHSCLTILVPMQSVTILDLLNKSPALDRNVHLLHDNLHAISLVVKMSPLFFCWRSDNVTVGDPLPSCRSTQEPQEFERVCSKAHDDVCSCPIDSSADIILPFIQ